MYTVLIPYKNNEIPAHMQYPFQADNLQLFRISIRPDAICKNVTFMQSKNNSHEQSAQNH